MEHWAMTVCVCCIVAGGLSMLLPKKEYTKSIKTVLALYILVSAIQPVSWQLEDWTGFTSQSAALQPIDLQPYTQQLEQQALQSQLEQLLEQQGLTAQVSVNSMDPLSITVWPQTERKGEVLNAVQQALAGMGSVEVLLEETNGA